MRWSRPSTLFTLVGILIVAGSGCAKKPEPVPAGSFRAVVENVIDDELVLVQRVMITAHGRRSVNIRQHGGFDRAWADPDRRTDLMTAQVIVMADLIELPSAPESILRWMVRVQSGGSTVGGPASSPAQSAESLQEIVSFRLDSGDYPLSRDITLGYVQDQELILRVE